MLVQRRNKAPSNQHTNDTKTGDRVVQLRQAEATAMAEHHAGFSKCRVGFLLPKTSHMEFCAAATTITTKPCATLVDSSAVLMPETPTAHKHHMPWGGKHLDTYHYHYGQLLCTTTTTTTTPTTTTPPTTTNNNNNYHNRYH